MSLLGIILFLVPIPVVQDGKQQTTLPIAFSWFIKRLAWWYHANFIVTIITVSGILTILCSTIYKNKLNPQGLMSSAFNVKIGWLVLRVLAVFFSWLTFLNIGPEMIKSEDTGGLVFSSLLPTLVAVFLFAAIFYLY